MNGKKIIEKERLKKMIVKENENADEERNTKFYEYESNVNSVAKMREGYPVDHKERK